jgi:hypothetical protein
MQEKKRCHGCPPNIQETIGDASVARVKNMPENHQVDGKDNSQEVDRRLFLLICGLVSVSLCGISRASARPATPR